jgi:hypothetical protein
MNRECDFQFLFDRLAETIALAKALGLDHVEYLLKLAIMEANQQAASDARVPTMERAAMREQGLSCDRQQR